MILTTLLERWTQSHNTGSETYGSMIPSRAISDTVKKNLFQICLRGENESAEEILKTLPNDFLDNIDRLKRLNPAWEYALIGDREAENFVRELYGDEVLRYYLRIDRRHGSARADFLKSLLLYAKGGVYLDLKSSLRFPLEQTLGAEGRFCAFYWDNIPGGKRHYLIPDSAPDGEYLMGIMASPAGHPYLREVIMETLKRIDHYNPYSVGIGWEGVQRVTGPAMYTDVLCRCRELWPEQPFRLARTFSDFGYVLSFQEQDYRPGQYQKKTGMQNYRTLPVPVVRSSSSVVQFINGLYLRLMKILFRR